MANYEAMFILDPNLNEEQRKQVSIQLEEVITKNGGETVNSSLWSEKRRLSYPIRKFQEGVYYLISFKASAGAILKLKQAYRLNESVVRVLITRPLTTAQK